jgi:hypothetical protein
MGRPEVLGGTLVAVTNDPGSKPDRRYVRRRERQIYKSEE